MLMVSGRRRIRERQTSALTPVVTLYHYVIIITNNVHLGPRLYC